MLAKKICILYLILAQMDKTGNCKKLFASLFKREEPLDSSPVPINNIFNNNTVFSNNSMMTRSKKTRVASEGSESEEVESAQNVVPKGTSSKPITDLPSNSSIGSRTHDVDFEDRGVLTKNFLNETVIENKVYQQHRSTTVMPKHSSDSKTDDWLRRNFDKRGEISETSNLMTVRKERMEEQNQRRQKVAPGLNNTVVTLDFENELDNTFKKRVQTLPPRGQNKKNSQSGKASINLIDFDDKTSEIPTLVMCDDNLEQMQRTSSSKNLRKKDVDDYGVGTVEEQQRVKKNSSKSSDESFGGQIPETVEEWYEADGKRQGYTFEEYKIVYEASLRKLEEMNRDREKRQQEEENLMEYRQNYREDEYAWKKICRTQPIEWGPFRMLREEQRLMERMGKGPVRSTALPGKIVSDLRDLTTSFNENISVNRTHSTHYKTPGGIVKKALLNTSGIVSSNNEDSNDGGSSCSQSMYSSRGNYVEIQSVRKDSSSVKLNISHEVAVDIAPANESMPQEMQNIVNNDAPMGETVTASQNVLTNLDPFQVTIQSQNASLDSNYPRPPPIANTSYVVPAPTVYQVPPNQSFYAFPSGVSTYPQNTLPTNTTNFLGIDNFAISSNNVYYQNVPYINVVSQSVASNKNVPQTSMNHESHPLSRAALPVSVSETRMPPINEDSTNGSRLGDNMSGGQVSSTLSIINDDVEPRGLVEQSTMEAPRGVVQHELASDSRPVHSRNTGTSELSYQTAPLSRATQNSEYYLNIIRKQKKKINEQNHALQRQNHGLELPPVADHQLTLGHDITAAVGSELDRLRAQLEQQETKIKEALDRTVAVENRTEVKLPSAVGEGTALKNRRPDCKPKLTDIVPKFFPPAYKWAQQIEETLKMVGYVRPYHVEMQPLIAPQILKECNPDLVRLCPKGSLEDMLDWLKAFDKNPGLRFPEHELRKRTLTTTPSIHYQRSLIELMDAYGRDQLDDYIRETAWRNMVMILPEKLRAMECVIRVDRFPTEKDLSVLDRAYYHVKTVDDNNNNGENLKLTLAGANDYEDIVKQLQKKIDEHEEKLKESTSVVNAVDNKKENDKEQVVEKKDAGAGGVARQGGQYNRGRGGYNNSRGTYQNYNRGGYGNNGRGSYNNYSGNARGRGYQNNNTRRPPPPVEQRPVYLENDTRELVKVEDGRELCYYHANYGKDAHRCYGKCQHKVVPVSQNKKSGENNSALYFSGVINPDDMPPTDVSSLTINQLSASLYEQFTKESQRHFSRLEAMYDNLSSLVSQLMDSKPCMPWSGRNTWSQTDNDQEANFETYAEVRARMLPKAEQQKVRPSLPMITVMLDRSTKIPFLVDTGAAHSIIKPGHMEFNLFPPRMNQLLAINNTRIPVMGHVALEVTIEGKKFQHEFVVANVGFNILGYDFLCQHRIMIEPSLKGPILHLLDEGAKLNPVSNLCVNNVISVVNEENGQNKKKFEDYYITYKGTTLQTILFQLGENDSMNILDERVKDFDMDKVMIKPSAGKSVHKKISKIFTGCAQAVEVVSDLNNDLEVTSDTDESSMGLENLLDESIKNYDKKSYVTEGFENSINYQNGQRLILTDDSDNANDFEDNGTFALDQLTQRDVMPSSRQKRRQRQWIAKHVKTIMYEKPDRYVLYDPKVIHHDRSSLCAAWNSTEPNVIAHFDTCEEPYNEEKALKAAEDIANNATTDLEKLKKEFPSCFAAEIDFNVKSKVPIEHKIETKGNFKVPYIYQVPRAYYEEAKAKLRDMEAKGMIKQGKSSYVSPMTCAKKKDGRLRLCGDFRQLNKITIPDRYPIPRIDEIKQNVRGNVFTAIDLKEGFYQISIAENDQPKTAMQTPFGMFIYLRMPFGLRNAPPTFQRYMTMVVSGMENVQVYIDDIVVYTQTYEHHKEVLWELFRRLAEHGLVINSEKSKFFRQQIEYLGYEITPSGYRPLEVILPKVEKIPTPQKKEDIQMFMGIVNYYRNHMAGLAHVAAPLYELINKGVRFKWEERHQKAFDAVKEKIRKRIKLVPFRKDGEHVLYTDASQVAAGAVLMQDNEPVAYFSRRFTPTEQRYDTHEREALAMVSACLYFKNLLLSIPFKVRTDHRSLERWLDKPPKTERHARWLTKIQGLLFEVEYVKGTDNVFADLMSRPHGITKDSRDELGDLQQQIKSTIHWLCGLSNGISMKGPNKQQKHPIKSINDRLQREEDELKAAEIKEKKKEKKKVKFDKPDMESTRVTEGSDPPKKKKKLKLTMISQRSVERKDEPRKFLSRSIYQEKPDHELEWHDKIAKYQTPEFMRDCGIDEWRIDVDNNLYIMHDWGNPRTILPECLRQEAIERLHNHGHYGVKRTRNMVAKYYYWKGLTRDVNKVVRACEECQKNKVTPSQRRDYRHFPVTSRFKTVHMDIVGQCQSQVDQISGTS